MKFRNSVIQICKDEDMDVKETVDKMHDFLGLSKLKRAKQNIKTPRLLEAFDKCKISDRDAVHLLTASAEYI